MSYSTLNFKESNVKEQDLGYIKNTVPKEGWDGNISKEGWDG